MFFPTPSPSLPRPAPRHPVPTWCRGGAWLGGLLCLVATAVGAAVPGPEARKHWAYQAVVDSPVPRVKDRAWPRNGLDAFVLARFEEDGLAPAPAADPRTLIRRMTFDLHGLPPTPDEVARFVAEMAADRTAAGEGRDEAVRRLVERLLASPRYGERWGRHWLDVARYSDTKGYVYGREERRFVHAPAYRDWVIRAFNDDLPYDRFLLLQIAADRLVPPGSPDLAAMGFVTGGRRFIGVTHDIIDDRIDVVTRGTLGLTVQCARCHDHKYDPIPTEDYYSLYGVFHESEDRLVPLAPTADAELSKRQLKLAETMAKRRDEAATRLRARVGDYLAAQFELEKYPEEGFDQIIAVEDLVPASVRRWRDYLLTSVGPAHPIFGPWHVLVEAGEAGIAGAAARLATVTKEPGINPLVAAVFRELPSTRREVAERYARVFAEAARTPDAPGAAELKAFLVDPRSPTVVPDTAIVNNEGYFPFTAIEELWRLQGEVDRRWLELGLPAALILADREPGPDPRVFRRGSPSRLGDAVPRRFLGILSGPDRAPFRDGSGRLELARAIVQPENPLTARVMVNRIWQHHFGVGLVGTPSDFGLRAEAPGHPALLDWLARRFVDGGWSIKSMHRLILGSATYRQASGSAGAQAPDHPPERLAQGGGLVPERSVRAEAALRPALRRLDFEQLRDAMLAVTGELDGTMGGSPRELLAADNRRRTVYALVDRQFLPGAFRTFDFANPDIHVAVRHETTVPQQALFFLNGAFAADRARGLAARVADLPLAERLQRLHRLLYQRDPAPREVALAHRFLEAAAAEADLAPAPVPPTPWKYGTGEYDEAAHRVKSFRPLPHFTGMAWQGAESWPGGETGWAQVTAEGGHPGNTRAQACIRRWEAPFDGVVSIRGNLRHEPEPGDGVRAFVLSSRHGLLKSATVHQTVADLSVERLEVKAGDIVDFLVDIGGVLNSDQFLWAPVVARLDGPGPGGAGTWDARAGFSGPAAELRRLTPWEQYAQVLLLANEFAFAD